ncbi:MAG: FAD:protein transferase [Gemmatimonadetes bacterium]|nr:FAD:protein transferase [Gemmatimonadota bacterium]
MSDSYVETTSAMGTVVTVQVVGHDDERRDAVKRALGWFGEIESRCSRFDSNSELSRLSAQPGIAVPVSPLLFQAVRFALAVAQETGGAFDPTVGHRMEARGFNTNFRTAEVVSSVGAGAGVGHYHDVHLDDDAQTITLAQPMMLDLGAVAKGLAVDLASRELQPFEDFAIDAGGDLYLGGCNVAGEPWKVGIRHPRCDGELIHALRISNAAVCTSGDYERPHHILDARAADAEATSASVTVIAPSAMVADALATAAFVLGPNEGLTLLERHGANGLIITPALKEFCTAGMMQLG